EILKNKHLAYNFDPTKKACFGVLPRYAKNKSLIKWFGLPNYFIFHNSNAREEGDDVVLITCRLQNPDLDAINETEKEPQRDGFTNELYEMRFNMKKGLASQKELSESAVDFPRVNENYSGRVLNTVMSNSMTTLDDGNITSDDQYKWLEKNLSKVDRIVTPWLVATWHPPWYSTYTAHYREAKCMKVAMEELLYEYGVDLVFNCHGAYERTSKVYNYKLKSYSPVHITVGDGGNREKMAIEHADEPGKCPKLANASDKFMGGFCASNFTSGPAAGNFCWDQQPEYSAYRESSFRHGIFKVQKHDLQSISSIPVSAIRLANECPTAVPTNLVANTASARIRGFTRMNPPSFFGSKSDEDPQEFLDKDVAHTWFKQWKVESVGDAWPIEWEEFATVFLDIFFPLELRESKVLEFINIKKGNMIVIEYSLKFTQLARYAPHVVAESRAKMSKFVSRVNDNVVNECRFAMLISEMDIARIIIDTQ
ncbi:Carotenoid 9,10(9',10')-cleavage dioxygenase 1, partial [Capsicum baccatum]